MYCWMSNERTSQAYMHYSNDNMRCVVGYISSHRSKYVAPFVKKFLIPKSSVRFCCTLLIFRPSAINSTLNLRCDRYIHY